VTKRSVICSPVLVMPHSDQVVGMDVRRPVSPRLGLTG
jgi:hypothetical protein